MLDKFIECLEDRNFNLLIISGSPPKEVLEETWQGLYMEFNDLMQDENHSIITDLVDRINITNAKIKWGGAVIQYLQHEYRDDIMQMLSKFGINIKLDPNNEAQYFKGLKLIVTRVKEWMLDVEEARVELSRVQEQQVSSGTNYDFFFDSLIELSKFNGYAIKAHEITVSQFTKMVQRLKKVNMAKQLKH